MREVALAPRDALGEQDVFLTVRQAPLHRLAVFGLDDAALVGVGLRLARASRQVWLRFTVFAAKFARTRVEAFFRLWRG